MIKNSKMHGWSPYFDNVLNKIVEYVRERLQLNPPPLDNAKISYHELHLEVGETITPEGLGFDRALKLFEEKLAPRTLSSDHPRYLSFIPNAPTEVSSLFDLIVSASSIYGGSWMEGAGAVFAENQALKYLADLAGYPDNNADNNDENSDNNNKVKNSRVGGVFVSGGTQGNLSALVAARMAARKQNFSENSLKYSLMPRWAVLISEEAHSSLHQVAEVMDIDIITVPVTNNSGILNRWTVEDCLSSLEPEVVRGIFAIIATAGSTNYGIIDDLDSLGDLANEKGWWFHVDGAYGIAGLADPNLKNLFKGIEKSDSLIVDPHKWFFAPYDCCALLYKDILMARQAHTQKAGYLDVLKSEPDSPGKSKNAKDSRNKKEFGYNLEEGNPSDYAVHLTRRVRGLPFWFSLAVHGSNAYTAAVQQTVAIATYAEEEIKKSEALELIRPRMLSVVVFRRKGWEAEDYHRWSDEVLAEGLAFVTPTKHKEGKKEETVTRFAIVNPRTTREDIDLILKSMEFFS